MAQAFAALSASPGARALYDAERASGALVSRVQLFAAMEALTHAGVGPVSVTQPDYVFEAASQAGDQLAAALR